jgi:hypothetical protein
MTGGDRRRPPGLRAFGLSVGGVFALVALWFAWGGRDTASTVAGALALALIVPALLRPSLLRRPAAAWFRLSRALGWVNTRLLLSTLFVVVLTPMGVVMRLAGWDPLSRRQRPAATGWVPYSARQRERRHYERMY